MRKEAFFVQNMTKRSCLTGPAWVGYGRSLLMKFKTISLAALFAGIHSVSAFSLDFTGLNGSTFSGADNDMQVIAVPGFGNVSFGVLAKGQSAEIGTTFGVEAIEFDDSQVITVDFFSGSQC